MAILRSQVFGRSLIGIYLAANNSYVLYPPTLLNPLLKKFKNVFEEPFHPITINSSNLVGVYTASNKYGIIVPYIIKEEEQQKLEEFLKRQKQQEEMMKKFSEEMKEDLEVPGSDFQKKLYEKRKRNSTVETFKDFKRKG